MRLYTRTGDAGESSLFNGERASKASAVFEALGQIDALNSAIGLARMHAKGAVGTERLCVELSLIQSRLIDAMAQVATPQRKASAAQMEMTKFDEDSAVVTQLEGWIDTMTEGLPSLSVFILPGGTVASAALHVARTACRTAERAVVALASDDPGVNVATVQRFLNRLSDYLFTAARWAAHRGSAGDDSYIAKDRAADALAAAQGGGNRSAITAADVCVPMLLAALCMGAMTLLK